MNRNKLQALIFKIYPHRLINAFTVASWAYKHPETIRKSMFEMLSDLMIMIMKVANENKHMMTHVAYVHPEEGEKQIVSIWAGAGVSADPLKRIAELIAENQILKEQLSELIEKNNHTINSK